jgi:hypothetical protein
MESETWVPVPDYEGYYEISNLARIRSIYRSILTKAGYCKPERTRIIIQRVNNKRYLTVTLSKNGHSRTQFVHRLYAQAFLPNPENKPILNHKNGDKLCNTLNNLEWVTYSENALHAYQTGLYKSKERRGRLIVDTCTGKKFTSIKKAAESLNIRYSTCRTYLCGSKFNPTCLQYAA